MSRIKSLKRKVPQFFLIVVISLILARVAAPVVGKYFINYVLSHNLENYTGSIEDLDLALILGQYQLEGFELRKKDLRGVPFVSAKSLLITLNWTHIFQGRVFMDVEGDRIQVNIVDAKDSEKEQFGVDEKSEHWKDTLDAIVPLSIQRIHIHNSLVQFENRDLKGLEKNKIEISQATVTDLITPGDMDDQLSPYSLEGKINNHAEFKSEGGVNIANSSPNFDINLQLIDLNLTTLNKLLRHYVPLDITSGKMTLYLEAFGSAKEGQGYTKVFFEDLDILKSDQNYVSTPHFFFEIIGGFGNWILDVITENRVATEIPLEWSADGFSFDGSATAWNALENSWDKIEPKFKNISPESNRQ